MADVLQSFVQSSLSKGMPQAELEQTLIKAGWPKDIVLKYLHKGTEPITPSKNAQIRAQGVSKSFDGKRVLDNVNLEIVQGEIFGIIGQSGSGKTTLLQIIAGLTQPEQGDVVVFLPSGPQSVRQSPEAMRSFIGYAAQQPSLYPDLTVEENLSHFGQVFGLSERAAKQKAASLLKLVGLADSKAVRAGNLSGGMQKRLDIACALVHDPKLLLMDEPVADLDVVLRTHLWDVLRSINKQGTTIVIASHFLADLESFCDRIGIMRNGRVAETGTPDELRVIYSRNQEVRVELGSHAYDELLASLKRQNIDVAKTIKETGAIKIQTSQPTSVVESIVQFSKQRKDALLHLEVGRPSVRELFEELFT
ncbi:ABC transporter ATP-binding protein [Candidatus Woesearchaeota archaeon]|nr:ABC transporter ATP-binding protein [Candidatus Woesearchaeota archaeon]